MPDSASALATPLALRLVPSPGYGPAVSSGMTAQPLPVLPVLPVPLAAREAIHRRLEAVLAGERTV